MQSWPALPEVPCNLEAIRSCTINVQPSRPRRHGQLAAHTPYC